MMINLMACLFSIAVNHDFHLMQHIAPVAPPAEITVVEVTSTSVRLEWTGPPPDKQNGVILQYILNVTVLGMKHNAYYTSSDVTSFTVDNLHPYTMYIAVIAAETSIGVGPFSSLITMETLEDG